MDEQTDKERIDELTHENRRLRSILACLSRAGYGKGASVDLLTVLGEKESKGFSVVVCRADGDEAAFGADVSRFVVGAMNAVFRTKTGVENAMSVGAPYVTGTTRNSESDGTPKGGA